MTTAILLSYFFKSIFWGKKFMTNCSPFIGKKPRGPAGEGVQGRVWGSTWGAYARAKTKKPPEYVAIHSEGLSLLHSPAETSSLLRIEAFFLCPIPYEFVGFLKWVLALYWNFVEFFEAEECVVELVNDFHSFLAVFLFPLLVGIGIYSHRAIALFHMLSC